MSGIVNKIKEALPSSNKHNETGTTGTTGYNDPEGVHGTHNSRAANAADPRIDSDRDHRGAAHHAPGTTSQHHTAGTTGGVYTGAGDAQTGTYTTGTGAVPGSHSGVTGVNDPQGTRK